MVGKWNGSVDIYENHDRRCILFSVLGRMFSWNRHGQEKSHGAAFLSRRSSKPCAKRLSAWKGCSEEEIHRCRLAQQSFAFHSRVFRFRTCAERRAELGRLSPGIPCRRSFDFQDAVLDLAIKNRHTTT